MTLGESLREMLYVNLLSQSNSLVLIDGTASVFLPQKIEDSWVQVKWLQMSGGPVL